MLDVCLVSMPYDALEQPSIGVGLLAAAAKKTGLNVKVIYAKFWFVEKIGYEPYVTISSSGRSFHLLGEWTFSKAAFPDFSSKGEKFYKEKLAHELDPLNDSERAWIKGINLHQLFAQVREQAVSFIEETAEKILSLNPKIVGCSSTFQQHCASLALLRRIKEKNPEIITLLGGANCEGPMGLANKKHFQWIDYVVSGEADELFPKFCCRLLENKNSLQAEELPIGVISSQSTGKLQKPLRATVCDLDRLPTPDYEDYFQELKNFKYKDKVPYPLLLMETSRGCWWGQKKSCTFCGLNGEAHAYRFKKPERVLEELETLSQRYAVNRIVTTDNILHMDYFKTLFPRLLSKGPSPYFFHWETKANLKQEQVRMLSQAGVRLIQAGVEHLHDESLKLLNKGVTALQNVALLKYGMENGIRVSWNFLFGIPGEKDEWYQELVSWLPLIYHLQPPRSNFEIRYDRFSRYYRDPDRYGLALSPIQEYAHLYPLPEEELKEMAYYFEDLNHVHKNQADAPGMAKVKAQINEWKNLFHFHFSQNQAITLRVKETKDQSFIIDTRPCAKKSEWKLEGLLHRVLQECDKPRSKHSVFENLQNSLGTSLKADAFEEALQQLREQKLILCLGERLLSLPLREPVRPILTYKEFLVSNVKLTGFLDSILQSSDS